MDSLKRLEYRGYDSAGVATLEGDHLERRRAEGKLKNLEARLKAEPLTGHTGIGHTRWATHGKPTENNAHPHATDRVAVVHNGIIENFRELRAAAGEEGRGVQDRDRHRDRRCIWSTSYLAKGIKPVEAVKATLPQLRGAFALGFIFAGDDDLMIGARNGPPLAIGYGDGEMYLGSDAIALGPFTDTISYLEDGDWVVLTRKGATIYDKHATPSSIARRSSTRPRPSLVDKANYRHFMAKEIHEQPEVVGHTLARYVDMATERVALPVKLPFDFKDIQRISITACGTASYAGYIAKYWFERLGARAGRDSMSPRNSATARRRCARAISRSSFRNPARPPIRWRRCATPKSQGVHTLSVVNVPTSTIARESETVLPTLAGPEIGVASTKAFTCQLMVLAALAVAAGKARGELSDEDEAKLVHGLVEIPRLMAAALATEPQIEKLARDIAKSSDVLYLGRGTSYPLALEGALKLKEISYIHAEGYAAGELKHGPIALIDENMPVVVIAPYDRVFEKTVSNMQEVAARGGNIILMTDAKGAAEATVDSLVTIVLPDMAATFTPMVYAVPVQLLAYHTAVVMGTDVDQPRNLAKSVTVE